MAAGVTDKLREIGNVVNVDVVEVVENWNLKNPLGPGRECS